MTRRHRYAAPRSFTERSVELTLHGSPVVVEAVIAPLVPTARASRSPVSSPSSAVLNGKLDLVQAESIADLVNARSSCSRSCLCETFRRAGEKAKGIREFAAARDLAARSGTRLFGGSYFMFISRADARGGIESALTEIRGIAETIVAAAHASADVGSDLGRAERREIDSVDRLVGSDRAIARCAGTDAHIVREPSRSAVCPLTSRIPAGLRDSDATCRRHRHRAAREAARNAGPILYLVDASSGVAKSDSSGAGSFRG